MLEASVIYNFYKKCLRIARDILLFPLLRVTSLSSIEFRGKRVAIVGPAEFLSDELSGMDLDGYDVIVRMNRALSSPISLGGIEFDRVDMLFHNSKEVGERSAGFLSKVALEKAGISKIVIPSGSYDKKIPYAILFAKLILRRIPASTLKCFKESDYFNSVNMLSGYSPTTGFCAIYFFSRCELEELALFGFSFFKTKYYKGYDDRVATSESAYDWARLRDIHNPDFELLEVRKLLALSRASKVTIGDRTREYLYSNSVDDNPRRL